nr:MAG TPA: hypothetical protein [Caudoviricetes sp.]
MFSPDLVNSVYGSSLTVQTASLRGYMLIRYS